MLHLPTTAREDELLSARSAASYNEAERRFSRHIQRKLYRLLRGQDNSFLLMRRVSSPRPALVVRAPAGVRHADLRTSVVKQLIGDVLQMLDPLCIGGPVAQTCRDGRVIDEQVFPTQYPHIVIERSDVFDGDSGACCYSQWSIVRVQNQHHSTMVNRALDIGNFALELSRWLPGL